MSNRDSVPGLRKRTRADGTIVWYWIASEVSPKAAGFGLKTVTLPGDLDHVRAEAMRLTANLRRWLAKNQGNIHRFSGTIASLIDCYIGDEDSPYHTVKPNTRRQYNESLRIIRHAVGRSVIDDLTRKDFARWHRGFRYPEGEDGPDRIRRAAHAMKLIRILVNFGASMRYRGCAETAVILHNMKFPLPAPRRKALGFDHAAAIVDGAIAAGKPSIALAQALQFELSLRQKDVIGEWTYEPAAIGLAHAGRRWSGGVLWSDVVDGVLTKQTTKTATVGEWPLGNYPLVAKALACFSAGLVGPMVVSERTGLPYRDFAYQREWRALADAAGVPRDIWNMDSRAGGITEADEAGADIRDVQRHATHSNASTTGRYVRRTGEATARVAELRVKHRDKGKAE